ncbi:MULTISPECIES: MlaD family protein [unclassified Rhodococcus (in: high G+C Gram-positive bacteria)]|uniref:MlaD family protein n=1 Tax=unclassified Rhodococcus (in: high G+C Gram-positive bacteria) TaxID=192944 RepID=UPI002078F29B|nr:MULTISPECIES: MlaD family protein [unclassified Rhodococcus (in: high G+C Gram-positive bacteria)]
MTIRTRTKSLTVALVVGVALPAAGCSLSLQDLSVGRSPDGPSYQISAQFDGVDRVVPGAEVRVGQEVVGRVSDVSTRNFTARVEMRIRDDVPIPRDATARSNYPRPSAIPSSDSMSGTRRAHP